MTGSITIQYVEYFGTGPGQKTDGSGDRQKRMFNVHFSGFHPRIQPARLRQFRFLTDQNLNVVI